MASIQDEYRALDDLRPNSRNYNRHTNPDTLRKMADKIRVNAFTAPFIIADDGAILGGHLRRLALLKLRAESYPEPEGVQPGWRVPCRVFTGNEAQELALLAGDNPDPGEIDFDNAALTALLADLAQAGALEGSGYDKERLSELIDELAGHTDGGDVPDFAPVSADEQGRLDQKAPVTCPHCGESFVPKA